MNKELLKESWSQVLQEKYEEGVLDEGFKDLYDKASEYLGFKNANRDQYKKATQKQSTGAEHHGSLGVSALNGANWLLSKMTGTEYKPVKGGYFDKHTKRNHTAEVNAIKRNVQSLMVNILSYLTLCRYLANDKNNVNYGFQPSKLRLVQNPVSAQGKRNSMQILQFVNDNTTKFVSDVNKRQKHPNPNMAPGPTNTLGFNMSEKESKMVLKKCMIANSKLPQNYQWLQNVFVSALRSAVVDIKWLGDKIDIITKRLNAIDIELNKYLWSKNVRDLSQIKNDVDFQQLIQQKVYIVNSEFQQVLQKANSGKQWNIYLENGKNIVPWFINMKELVAIFNEYKEFTDEKFLQMV